MSRLCLRLGVCRTALIHTLGKISFFFLTLEYCYKKYNDIHSLRLANIYFFLRLLSIFLDYPREITGKLNDCHYSGSDGKFHLSDIKLIPKTYPNGTNYDWVIYDQNEKYIMNHITRYFLSYCELSMFTKCEIGARQSCIK